MKPTLRDYLQLHLIVLIFGFTAILGRLVTIPALSLVFWRTGLAAIGLWLILKIRKGKIPYQQLPVTKLLLTGSLVAIHWILFFGSARVSNVSVCLAGMSTGSLWTAIVEPIFTRRRISGVELFLAVLVIIGLYMIFLFEFDHALGLAMSVAAALLAAFFSVFNSIFSKQVESQVITAYEMSGAWLTCVVFLPLYYQFFAPNEPVQLWPEAWDWGWIALLVGVCTIFAYSIFVQLFRKFSAFVMNLTVNLEPIYGILLAFLIFGEAEKMTLGFYAGATLILAAVLLYPVLNYWSNRNRKKTIIEE